MKSLSTSLLLLLTPLAPYAALGGQELESGKDKVITPVEESFPAGSITVGYKGSEDLQSGYLDSITPFWAPGNAMFFLNTRTTYNDEDQTLSSYGLGLRYRVPDQDIIFGVNAYYDRIHSRLGNDFDQLGLGAEILTRWVDARFNYYLPENDSYVVDRHTSVERSTELGPVYGVPITNGVRFDRNRREGERRRTTRLVEGALEGWNAEVGFLVPGLDEYLELRVYAGAYYYDNPVGDDFSGFKARLEARLLPGVIADVEYWDDEELTGGHWTGGVRVTVPFSLGNLFTGRNPFEGAGEMFRPRKREFKERMGDMVMRSPRVFTASDEQTEETTTEENHTDTVGQMNFTQKKKVVVASEGGGQPPP